MKLHEKEMRAVYTDTIIELMTENPKVVCLEADLGKSSGTVPGSGTHFRIVFSMSELPKPT